jgi:hypothetical protein
MPAQVTEGNPVAVSLISIDDGVAAKMSPSRTPPKDKIFVCNTYVMTLGNTPILVLGRTPKRCYAHVVCNGNGQIAFGTSMSDCQDAITVGTGQQISGVAYVNSAEFNSNFTFEGTTELWAVLVTAGEPAPSVITPAVPATGVAAQNTNPYPVTVVINANGATITNVSVNGVTVGTAAGTYVVPAYGSISIAYTVATPLWTFANATYAVPTTIGVFREIDR